MKAPILALLIAITAFGCASTSAQETSYNQGVAAYKAKDYASAREHWRKAIVEGQVFAFNNLGYLLYTGLGGERDHAQAVSLWKNGALLGHSEAQWHLGQALAEGKGISQNFVEAYAWYRCSIASAESASHEDRQHEDQITEGARQSLTKLLSKLTPEELSAGELLAKQYIARQAALRKSLAPAPRGQKN